MGKLIAIDGLDGSGKGTQAELLRKALEKRGNDVSLVSFPRYDAVGATFVKMYLNGTLGMHPNDTNAYAASTFFAIDRYLSYRTEWKEKYESPSTYIIADRYTTANAVHQLSKLPRAEWDTFLTWLWEYEFQKLQLPEPDLVLYLELPPALSLQLVERRSRETGQKKDIHELDSAFMEKSYQAALYASDKLGWVRIPCYRGNELKTREEIQADLWNYVSKL